MTVTFTDTTMFVDLAKEDQFRATFKFGHVVGHLLVSFDESNGKMSTEDFAQHALEAFVELCKDRVSMYKNVLSEYAAGAKTHWNDWEERLIEPLEDGNLIIAKYGHPHMPGCPEVVFTIFLEAV